MEFCYYYLLYISFWICVCLHMMCIKENRKQVWGKHTATMKQDPIVKIMKSKKQRNKNHACLSLTRMGMRVGRPTIPMGRLS